MTNMAVLFLPLLGIFLISLLPLCSYDFTEQISWGAFCLSNELKLLSWANASACSNQSECSVTVAHFGSLFLIITLHQGFACKYEENMYGRELKYLRSLSQSYFLPPSVGQAKCQSKLFFKRCSETVEHFLPTSFLKWLLRVGERCTFTACQKVKYT